MKQRHINQKRIFVLIALTVAFCLTLVSAGNAQKEKEEFTITMKENVSGDTDAIMKGVIDANLRDFENVLIEVSFGVDCSLVNGAGCGIGCSSWTSPWCEINRDNPTYEEIDPQYEFTVSGRGSKIAVDLVIFGLTPYQNAFVQVRIWGIPNLLIETEWYFLVVGFY